MKEKQIMELADIYLKFYKRYSFTHFKLSQLKNTKWYRFFEQAINDFSNRKEWNSYKFIASQFEKYGKILPFQLVGDRAWKTYLDYHDRLEKETDKGLVISLLSTYKKMKGQKFEDFVRKNKFLIEHRNIDYKLFLFYDKFYDIFDPYDIDKN